MKKLLVLWVFITAIVAAAHAQDGESNCNDNIDNDNDGLVDCRDCANKVCEVCNDGLDNDGDGFIDCYDKECSVDAACNGFFIGKDLVCEARPSTFPAFEMTEDFHSPTGLTHHLSKILVADVDQDGKPEIISLFRNLRSEFSDNATKALNPNFTSTLYVLSPPAGGTEMTIKASRQTQGDGVFLQHEGDIATADVDRDGDAEIFVVSGTRGGTDEWAIMAYTYNKGTNQLDKFWSAPVQTPNDPGNMGLADFDGDGKVELYARDRIYDAHTGVEMGKGNNWTGTDWRKESSGSTAVDILADGDCGDCQGLELVSGCRIYSVAINRSGTPTATITKVKERTEYFTRTGLNNDNSTSVADFDLDGNLDVLAVGSKGDYNSNTTIFYWNLHKGAGLSPASNPGELKTFSESYTSQTGTTYPGGWTNGAGRINIADIDGDGQLNAVYVSGRYLYALEDDPGSTTTLKKFFREDVTEETSGITGCTLFDFNADGTSEIVYRDEETLFIFTTTYPIVNGSPDYNQAPIITKSSPVACKSRTYRDYPIVADVDGDGSTEICVTCSTNTTTAGKNLELFWDDKGNKVKGELDDGEARVMVFKSANEPWVPARRLWNQHGYFVVNVNDDLTIPTHQQKHQSVYARNVVCLNGRDSRPLNSFLNQAPFLNSQGCPSFAAPNLAFLGGVANIQVTPPTCPQKDFKITFEILNKGDVSLNGTVPISFYNGDPRTASATKLLQVDLAFNNVLPGGKIKLENQTVTGPGSNFPLYIVINHDGLNNDNTTLPIKFPGTNFIECDYTDNIISVPVNPAPAPLVAEIVKNNIVCDDGATDPLADGEAKAYILGANNAPVTQNFTFVWSNGDFVNTPPNYTNNPNHKTGSTYSGLAAGTYTVYAIHNTIGCGSFETKVVVVDSPVAGPEVEIKANGIVNPTSCRIENGSLTATATGASSNVVYTWYRADQIETGQPLGTGPTLSGLGGGNYAVVIYDQVTGCKDNDSQSLIAPLGPKVNADSVNVSCTAVLPPHTVTANVTNPVNGRTYNYIWYNGDITASNTGWWDPTEFHYPGELPPGQAGQSLQKPVGKYSVIAYDVVSECLSVPSVTQVIQTTPPQVSISNVTAQTSCNPVASHNGAATASVAGGQNIFKFEWFAGQNTSGTPKKTESNVNTSTITGLTVGTYSVKVTNLNTGCSTVQDDVIISNGVVPYTINVNATDKTLCSSDGTVTATVLVNGVADANQNNYTFFWYKGKSKKPTSDFPGNTDNVLENAEPGFYTVYAKHKTLGCETGIKFDEVQNLVPQLALSVSDFLEPNTCTATGYLEFSFAPSDLSRTNANDYNIRWFRGTDVSNTSKLLVSGQNGILIESTFANGKIVSKASGLGVGLYTLQVTNPATNCTATASEALNYIDAPLIEITNIDPITTCDPRTDGAISFTLEIKNGARSINDYSIFVYQGNVPSGPIGTGAYEQIPSASHNAGDVHPLYNFTTINTVYPEGTYTIVALDNVINCPTEDAAVIFEDIKYPQLDLASAGVDQYCVGGNGQLTVNVAGAGNLNDYEFTWVDGSNLTFLSGNGLNSANALSDGNYMITVEEIATGCATDINAIVISNPMTVSIETLTTADVMTCQADGTTPTVTGEASVAVILEDNANVPSSGPGFTNYNFDWSTNPGVLTANASVSGLEAGTVYTVKAIHAITGCFADKSFDIMDKTSETVDVFLVDFKQKELCMIDPTSPEAKGHVEVIAVGTGGNDYTFNWQPVGFYTVDNSVTGDRSKIIDLYNVDPTDPTKPTDYTVEVTNNVSGCKVTKTFGIGLDINPIQMTTSKVDLTNCAPLNGALEAVVVGFVSDFEYTWSYQDITNNYTASNEVASNTIAGLGVTKNITVKVIDMATPLTQQYCVTSSTIADILDLRVYPDVIATEVAPVTNCVNPFNGVASASVKDDESSNYVFNWFNGATVTPPAAFTGVEYGDLSSAIYTVEAVHRITGCTGTTQVQITNQPIPVPMPAIEILSHVTSCEPGNNGILAASVDGKIVGYTFDWYDGAAEKSSPDFIGDTYSNLVVGIYSVIATDDATGCRSPLVSEELLFQPKYPDFDFVTVNATCVDPSQTNGQPNGAATMILLSDVQISRVTWEPIEGESLQMGTQFNEVNLQNAFPGKYLVTVTTALGCSTQKEVEIGTEIHPFNGVSRNKDGYNDIFYINCIENFPSNLVKIFNRAGTLVYEAEGYDNANTYFDGQSNKGVSLMGTSLPDGTYFYIIDKRDGSKPLAGYLEVVK